MPPFTPLVLTLTALLGGLRELIGRHTIQHRASTPLLVAVWLRLERLRNRLDRLVLAWERDCLPTPRQSTNGSRPARTRTPPAIRFPSAHGWLARMVLGAGGEGERVLHFLESPEIRALVAAAPQAGRILRPLACLFGFAQPDHLKLPPRPPRPRNPSAAALARAAEAALPPLYVHDETRFPYLPRRYSLTAYLLDHARRRRRKPA